MPFRQFFYTFRNFNLRSVLIPEIGQMSTGFLIDQHVIHHFKIRIAVQIYLRYAAATGKCPFAIAVQPIRYRNALQYWKQPGTLEQGLVNQSNQLDEIPYNSIILFPKYRRFQPFYYL